MGVAGIRVDEGFVNENEETKMLEETEFKNLEKYICKVIGNEIGTGFFCKIKYNNKLIPVLMTNYHIINDEYIKKKICENLYKR